VILLNPGPVTLSPRVRQALLQEDLCHREPEFATLTLDIRSRLQSLYPTEGDSHVAVLLTGSGTAAVEAMLATLVPRDAVTLVLCNGVYGERMADILARQGKALHRLTLSWHEGFRMDILEGVLDAHPDVRYLAAVQHETTTGRLNSLPAIGAICKARGIRLLLDAVSSFGAEDIQPDAWNLVAAAATANKCLHGVPGVAFVLARREELAQASGNAQGLYLDLTQYAPAQEAGWSPFTQSVQVFYALQAALMELRECGGPAARRQHYRTLSLIIRNALESWGVAPLLPEQDSASMLSAFLLPIGLTYTALHGHLKEAGFIIYAGQGALSEKIFRIATMGYIQDPDMTRLLACLPNALGVHPQ
jgi:2-aminoethylphosphonate-pyruvate transaminase